MCWVSRMVLALGDVFIIFISVGDHQRDLKKKKSAEHGIFQKDWTY